MNTRAGRNLRGGAVAAALLAVIPALRADLAPSSPFLPTGSATLAGGASGPSGPIELRGMMQGPDGEAYCIYDTAKKKDVWVGLNELGHEFVIKSADAGTDSVTVTYQGRTMKLSLHTAKIASAGSGGSGLVATPVGNNAVVTPSPAEEQRRLDAVAQEVRRRRAERERAAGEAPGGGAVPGGPPGSGMPPPPPGR